MPSVGPREEFQGIATMRPSLRLTDPPRSVHIGRLVAPPAAAQRVASPADGGRGGQRGAQRIQYVVRARGGPPQVIEPLRHLGGVPPVPQLREPLGLLLLDR